MNPVHASRGGNRGNGDLRPNPLVLASNLHWRFSSMSPPPFLFDNPTLERLARVVSDLLPETAHFTDACAEAGDPALHIDWTISPFSRRQSKVAVDIVFVDSSLARYASVSPKEQARAEAVLRAYLEAVIGSMEEQYALGKAIEPLSVLELGREFA